MLSKTIQIRVFLHSKLRHVNSWHQPTAGEKVRAAAVPQTITVSGDSFIDLQSQLGSEFSLAHRARTLHICI